MIVKTDGSFAALLLTRQILGNGHMVRTGNRVNLSQFSLNCGQATHNKSWPAGDRGVRASKGNYGNKISWWGRGADTW